MEAKDLITKESEEKDLRDAGVTDLIELMKCRNCKSYDNGICKASDNKKVNANDYCASFDEIDSKNELKGIYETIKEVLKEFVDTKEENYTLIALWILGTWMHKEFPSYPYLFVNAMKGSGKTRLLKLIKELSWQGDMLASLSEAVLFRTTGTLCIDEFEGISGKDKNALRELLNTAYKKGGKVKRMRKKKTIDGEQQVVEEFSTYRPIVMANIYGMEDVLGDRCINIVLEKSANKITTRMIEDFENHQKIKLIREFLLKPNFSVVVCSDVVSQNIYMEWNDYIKNTTLNYTTTLTTLNTIKQHLFTKIEETGINGRNLELFFPMLLLANEVKVLDEFINIVNLLVINKKEDDVFENRDIMLYEFVSKEIEGEFRKLNELVSTFKHFINYEEEDETRNWLNNKWMGKALKRLNLVLKKRRVSDGVQVILDIEKAKKKMEMFR